MKKTISLLCLGMAFCLASCSDDDNNKVTMPETPANVPFSLTATLPVRSNETRTENTMLNGKWNEGSQLAVLKNTASKTPKTTVTKSASSPDQFTGEISTLVSHENELAICYPTTAYTMTHSDTLTQVLDLSGQDGTLAHLTRYDYAWAKAKAVVNEDKTVSAACEMTPLMTIGKFQFTADGTTPLDQITRVTVTATSGKLYSRATLQLKYGTLTRFIEGSIKVQNPEGISNTTYLSLFPGEVQLHFTLVTANNQIYEATTELIKLEKGTVYTSPILQCTSLQPARIGDYFYSDATYSTQKDENKTCIGIVFALEDANGKLLTQEETSPYGRIVALKDNQTRVRWMGKPNDVEGIANDTTVNGTLKQGALPYYNGHENSYFTDKAEEQIHGATIQMDKGQIATWATQGALSDFQGMNHTACFKNNSSSYPAGALCSQYSTPGTTAMNWYLPAGGELALLWELYKSKIICAENKSGFHDFLQKSYWSSSEHSAGKAWYINFISGFMVANSKNSVYATRPVSRF